MKTFNDFDASRLDAQSVNESEIQLAEDSNAIVADFDLAQQPTIETDGQALWGPVTRKLEGFLFLPSYLESYEALLNGGERDRAYLLLNSIIAYGTERKRITNDPVVTAIMMSIEKTIDAGAAKRNETLRKKQERAAKRKNPLLD